MPQWATPLSPAEFAQFRDQLRDVLMPYGYVLGDGFVTVRGRASQYGLTNLLQQWPLVEHSDRAVLIEGHFRSLFQAEDSEPPKPKDVLALIRPRIWSSDTLNSVESPLITRSLAFDLEEVLCVDLPSTVVNLKPEQAEATGRPIGEL